MNSRGKVKIRVLWLCGVPFELQQKALGGRNVGAYAAWSWVMGHLPPPCDVELHIACPAKNIREDLEVEYKGAVFHLFPYLRGAAYNFYLSWLPGFRRVFRRIRPDWVHGWGTEAGFSSSALLLSRRRSIVGIQGIITDYRSHMPMNLSLPFNLINESITLRRARRFLAESEYSRTAAQKHTRGMVRMVHHPLRDMFLQEPVGRRGKKEIVFLGALNDGKGTRDALHAFARGAPSDWRFLCIGKGSEEYLQKLKDLIHQLGLDGRVEFKNDLTSREIIQVFRDTPVFLLPSYMDTGPTALKEALAMGLWPVCYDNSGPRELIGRYGYGSLVETGNVEQLGDVLKQVLEQRPWTAEGVADVCAQRVRHDLSPATIWGQLRECYTEEFWKRDACDR